MQFGLKPDTIARIHSVLAAHPEVEQAVLYGSRAKGNYRAGSDIDLCLKGEALTLTQLMKIENELDDLLLPPTRSICPCTMRWITRNSSITFVGLGWRFTPSRSATQNPCSRVGWAE